MCDFLFCFLVHQATSEKGSSEKGTSEKGSTLKGKNLLPPGRPIFRTEAKPFWQRYLP